MRLRGFCGLVAVAAAATGARADDAVHVGARPGWVVPVEEPAPGEGSGAIAPRLFDIQSRIDEQGTHQFTRRIFALKAPEALQAMGTVGAAWQPAFDRVTFHSILIHRGADTIDVLKDGKAFTVLRRETGLEQGLLDGQLTAVLQVPDLRVGDELEVAFTTDRDNPVLMGHAELDYAFLGGVTVDRLSLRASWPASRPVRWRAGDALPKPLLGRAADQTVLSIDRRDYTLPIVPADAPARFIDTGRLQIGDFADWRALSAQLAPLFEAAATLRDGSPLRAEAARIAAATTDPVARAEAALALVEAQVRYFARADGLGGYTPEDADAVWAKRSGDCKGKTVLLVALLRALGIEAEPALVSAAQGDGVDQSLPIAGRFDHVVARATVGGKVYWLDGTRLGDRSLARVAVPAFSWALPLRPAGADLVRLVATEPTEPQSEWRLDLDASKGLEPPAIATGTGVFRGDVAMMMRAAITVLDSTQRDTFLRKLWAERHDWVTIDKVSSSIDDASGEVRIGFTGTGKMDWSTEGAAAKFRYEANKARLGRSLTPDRPAGVGSSVPVVVQPEYEVIRQTIVLPKDVSGFFVEGDAIDETIGGIHYTRSASVKDGRFDMVATTRSTAGEISPADAKAADEKMNTMFAKQLFVRLPSSYLMDQANVRGKAAESADMKQVDALVAQHDLDGAVRRLDAMLAKQPADDRLRTRKAIILLDARRFDDADIILDAQLAANSSNLLAMMLKADGLRRRGRFDDALILLDRALLVSPGAVLVYAQRADVRAAAGKTDQALADIDIVIGKQPDNAAARLQKANILSNVGRRADALAEADALLKIKPDDPLGLPLRANLLWLLKREDEALAAADMAVTIAPSSDAYATRLSMYRRRSKDAVFADLLALARIDAMRLPVAGAVAAAAADPGKLALLKTSYEASATAAKVQPERLREILAVLDEDAGNPAPMLALTDARAAKSPTDDMVLNEACWARATHRTELDKALTQCDAALAIRSSAATLDSRALVHLQRDEFALAVSDYDKALAINPRLASSLFGRGIAHLRLGDKAAGEADIAQAVERSPTVEEAFARYGVSRTSAR